MVILRNKQADNFIKSPSDNVKGILIYGQDLGLISHRSSLLIDQLVTDKNDPFQLSKLSTEILNGRFHQIRSQLAQFGFPVKGDVKYGARRGNKDRSINLHSYKIEFADRSNQRLSFKAKFPKDDNLWNIVSEAIEKNKF